MRPRVVANASHELRTPLARQRTVAQVALADHGATVESLRAAHQRALAAGVQQEPLIDALLAFSGVQAGLDRRDPFDRATVARRILGQRQQDADQPGVELHASLSAAPAAGDARSSSVRSPTWWTTLCITTTTVGSTSRRRFSARHAVLTLTNTGPVVPAADVDRILQPYSDLRPTAPVTARVSLSDSPLSRPSQMRTTRASPFAPR